MSAASTRGIRFPAMQELPLSADETHETLAQLDLAAAASSASAQSQSQPEEAAHCNPAAAFDELDFSEFNLPSPLTTPRGDEMFNGGPFDAVFSTLGADALWTPPQQQSQQQQPSLQQPSLQQPSLQQTPLPMSAVAPSAADTADWPSTLGHTVREMRIQTANGNFVVLPPGVPHSIIEYIKTSGPDENMLSAPQAMAGTYSLDLPLEELHQPSTRQSDTTSPPGSDSSGHSAAGDDDASVPTISTKQGRRSDKRRTATAATTAPSTASAGEPSSKRPRRLSGASGASPSSSSSEGLSLAVRGAAGQPKDRKTRHKQTEDVRRHRINNAIDELRKLLCLETRTGKADVLEKARQTILEKSNLVQPALEMPSLPRLAIIMISCTTQTMVDANSGAMKALGLTREDLQEKALCQKIQVHEDHPFVMPGFVAVVSGSKQSVTVCKRFRVFNKPEKIIWGRLTLTRSLFNNEVYLTGVGSFFDEAPTSGIPYYIL